MTKRFLAATILAVTTLLAGGLPADADTATFTRELPLPYDGDAGQVVTVVGADETATTAELTAWRRSGSGWRVVLGPVSAFVGKQGIGEASESTSHTPAGVWTLTEGFGNEPGDDYKIPYLQIDENDWWVSDTESEFYNQYYRCAPGECPFDEAAGEDLGRVGRAYDRAAVIDYNRDPATPGAGSAFFLHVSTGKPTAGCVSIPARELDLLLKWLDPAKEPVIDIGIA
ncbi:L,D-peptidoglycan transpeptidase YkuD, ErfK/YbiS/YcfS/YnhG family [Amycolatopsis xylanica]|uniref:L,D-peptidoglycan transpeptidase YkuD, ErfK/YbiS/YcfS/YnhG family n=1 Tax=Amycolatopsis xylanica TaxID=589385 RepID=A0A1H2T097_9PSEU|nr:L,D-transpeptidase family protein [Amycolatopsis xylanica]SDW37268.1 L,D-peptidoglycan transpeptidase YkuD, ErfK/YbiS/YcfS/YnhG family [Amycolatopsis xylanica]